MFFEANIGSGGLFRARPTCTFQGKEVPCYITAMPHGGINGAILTDTLCALDELKTF